MLQEEFPFSVREVQQAIYPWQFGVADCLADKFDLKLVSNWKGRQIAHILTLGISQAHCVNMFNYLHDAVAQHGSSPGWCKVYRSGGLRIEIAQQVHWHFTSNLLAVRGRSLDIALYPSSLDGLAVSALTPCLW